MNTQSKVNFVFHRCGEVNAFPAPMGETEQAVFCAVGFKMTVAANPNATTSFVLPVVCGERAVRRLRRLLRAALASGGGDVTVTELAAAEELMKAAEKECCAPDFEWPEIDYH